MKLSIDSLRDPTRVLELWKSLSEKTFGKQLFARAIALAVPYTGSVSPLVTELSPGHARVQIRDRWGVRNHLKCVHAVALMNLGEAVTGLAVMSSLPPGARGIVRELSMEYLKKARGTITGEAQVSVPTASGSHDFDAHGELRNSIGEVVARVRARWRLEVPAAEGAASTAPLEVTPNAEADAPASAASGLDVPDEGEPHAGTKRPPAGDLPDEVDDAPTEED